MFRYLPYYYSCVRQAYQHTHVNTCRRLFRFLKFFFFLLLTSSFRCPYRKLLAACAIIALYVGPTLIVVCGVDVR